jgi:hypothetical protein
LSYDSLLESIDLERRADLEAFACNFGAASYLMKQANRIREREFGKADPNTLRDLTHNALEPRNA